MKNSKPVTARTMDLEIVEIFFKIGKFFALTPSSLNNQIPNLAQKVYEILLFLLYTAGFILSCYHQKPNYDHLTSIQFVLAVMCDFNEFFFQFYTLFVILRYRRRSWFDLVRNFKIVPNTPHSFKLIISGTFFSYVALTLFGLYAAISSHDDIQSYMVWLTLNFQSFSQFFSTLAMCMVLRMFLARYRHQSNSLRHINRSANLLHFKPVLESVRKMKYHVFVLKECVEGFNYIFGWTILSTIFTTAMKTLIYLDLVIKKESLGRFLEGDEADTLGIAHEISLLLVLWIGILSTIFICDTILNESDDILAQAYQLENGLGDNNPEGHEEMQVFIDVIQNNRPEFRAARFFSIDRSTLFSILNSLTTFLLVMIQFKTG